MQLRLKHLAWNSFIISSMAVGFAVAPSSSTSAADATGQKSAAKSDAAPKESKTSAATFEVYKDKAGDYRWRLKVSNGQVIASSGQGYKDKRDCLAGIDSVKRHAADAKVDVQDAAPPAKG